MKTKIIYCCLFILFSSCGDLFESYNQQGYRDGSDSGILINDGSLIGSWEETYTWNEGDAEYGSSWYPLNIKNSNNYVFLSDGTFTSTNDISDCLGSNGTYIVEGSKITLKYICETQPEVIKEVVIKEFFFRENYAVFIYRDSDKISKIELKD